MITKKGVSLVVLIITIIVMIILTGIAISQTDNILGEIEKDEFVVELSEIEDKIREYYLLTGTLPVETNLTYTANEIKTKIANQSQMDLLEKEINMNNDVENMFFVVNTDALGVEIDERGKLQQETDVFVVASNTLNVYYLMGHEYDETVRFSLVTLTDEKIVQKETINQNHKVTLDNQLSITKNTEMWTNEIKLTIKNVIENNEAIKYSVGGANLKILNNSTIVINSANMSENEKSAFVSNKKLIINKLLNDSVIETKEVDISNLDISNPSLKTLEMLDTTTQSHNIIRINSVDEGSSGIKCLYYDYKELLVNNTSTDFYSNRSEITTNELLNFGKITNDGIIKLEKNIKSIDVIALDNAGNTSNITTYTIEDKYLVSK